MRIVSSFLLAGLFIAAGYRAAPLAVIVKVDGTAEVQRAATNRPAQVGLALEAGDRVVPTAGGRVVLLHKSGRTEVAAQAVTIQASQEADRAGLFSRTVRTLDNVAAATAKTDPNRQGMIRPIPGTPAPIAPRNGMKVLDTRPTLTWFSVPGAEGYTVQLRRDGAAPIRWDTDADTSWTLPSTSPALLPGATYQWTVAPRGSARVAPPQSFTVASASDYTSIAQALDALAATGLDPAADGAFLAAVIYHDAGFAYEADGALAVVEATGDPVGRSFLLLRGAVHDALGRLDEAAAAFARADQGL